MILVFADLHIHPYKRFGDPGSRLGHFDKCLRLILKAAQNKKVEAILFCGDLFEKHGTVSAQVLNLVTERFKGFEETGIPFVAISGNHDISNRSEYGQPVHTALEYLDLTIGNFHLIDNSFIDLPSYRVNGIRYMSSKESIEKQLKKVELSDEYENILLMHNTPPNSNAMITPDIDINNPDIQQFDIIFNGHIHKRESDGKFHTVGNPIQRDATDVGQEKGVYLYGNKQLKFVSLNNHLPEIHIKEPGDHDEELVITKPAELELVESDIVFEDYNQLFTDYIGITNTGDLDKKKLIETIKVYL